MTTPVSGNERFRGWLVGGLVAALLVAAPSVAAVIGWFVQLPVSAAEMVWSDRDAALGVGPPGRWAQGLFLLAHLAAAAVFGAVGAALRAHRGAPDRHPAAQAIRGGLSGSIALSLTRIVLTNVAFREGRDLWYVLFGPGGQTIGAVAGLCLLVAIVEFFSLASRDTALARAVWRTLRVAPEFTEVKPMGAAAAVWSRGRIAAIAGCMAALWVIQTTLPPLATRLAPHGPAGWWELVLFVGLAVLGMLLLGLCMSMLILRGVQTSSEREERASPTHWRSTAFVRRPALAGLLVAVVVGAIAALAMRSGVLQAVIEEPLAGQLLAARRRWIDVASIAFAPVSHFRFMHLFVTRPAALADILDEITPEGRALVVVVHASISDLELGTKLLRRLMSNAPPEFPPPVQVRPFEEEMQVLEATLKRAPNVFFLVDGEDTDPRHFGAPSAQRGRFEAEGRDPEGPFRARLYTTHDGEFIPALPVLLASYIIGIPGDRIALGPGGELKVGRTAIPVDDEGAVLISGRRAMTPDRPGVPLPPSLREEVQDALPAGQYQAFYLLVPSNREDMDVMADMHFRIHALDRTTEALVAELLPGRVPGLRPILSGCRIVRPAPFWVNLGILWILCLWGAVMSVYLRPWHAAVATLTLVSILLVAAILLLTLSNVLVQTGVPLLAMLGVWVGGAHATQVLVDRRRRHVTATLGRYVSQQVADKILGQEEIALGGETRRVTVMFADIRGFGRLSERMSPRETMAMLNDYFAVITDVVFEFGGTLDKFIGDAAMAVWGAPLEGPDDTANAVRAAATLQERINDLCRRRAARGEPVAEIAIGLSTGEVVAGNVGDIRRMEYTVIGDEVVVAVRLQSMASAGPAQVLMSSATYEAVEDMVEVRPLGAVEVRHREQPVSVYELVGLRSMV